MESLFAELGGRSGLTRIVELTYERILADDYLGEYFMDVDIDRLKASQVGYLARLFGDTESVYGGAPLQAAHKGQLVTEQAFDMFIDLFVAAAAETGLDTATQNAARAALKALRAHVIMEFKPNPAYNYPTKSF
jgi:truncated hemoglobin YjbI